MNTTYLTVDSRIVPAVYLKVVEAKMKIASGKFASANDAIKEVGISRSTFYKYKDYVFATSEIDRDRLVTIELTLDDIAGVLSRILNTLAENRASVLTINQNIPINDIANITITFKMENIDENLEKVIEVLKKLDGVNKARVIAMN